MLFNNLDINQDGKITYSELSNLIYLFFNFYLIIFFLIKFSFNKSILPREDLTLRELACLR